MPLPQSIYEFPLADRQSDGDAKGDGDVPGFGLVSVGGELDLATAPKLDAALAAVPSGTAVVILDLRELTFMDSSGLHLILNATARLAKAGCRLVLIPGGGQIQQIFEITGTRQHLEFVAAPDARDRAIVPPERRKNSSLDPSGSHPDWSRSPPEGRAPGSRPPHAGVPR